MSAIGPLVAIVLCLAAAGVVSWDLAPLVLKPRVRRPAATANPGGAAHAPAAGAAPATPWALAPVLYGERGANPYPADTLTDMPAVEDGPRIHPLYQEWERKQAERWWML